MSQTILVRYGAIPEVSQFAHDLADPPLRHDRVVVISHRGLELGTALETVRRGKSGPPLDAQASATGDRSSPGEPEYRVLRRATRDDETRQAELRRDADQAFGLWQARIREWNLDLELLDLEWLLDRQKLVLYVLGGRGAETTKLALQAAAAGPVVVEVQPVSADGLVPMPSGGGGCGSGGCGCH